MIKTEETNAAVAMSLRPKPGSGHMNPVMPSHTPQQSAPPPQPQPQQAQPTQQIQGQTQDQAQTEETPPIPAIPVRTFRQTVTTTRGSVATTRASTTTISDRPTNASETLGEGRRPRRSSIGVASTLIFPRSAADRHKSNKRTKELEESFGLHFFTNTFSANPLMEKEYTDFFIETSINPASYASLVSWFLWILVSIEDVYNCFSDSKDIRAVAWIKLGIASIVFFPVPVLIAASRLHYFVGYEQTFFCAIVHCFAIVILLNGAVPMFQPYRNMLLRDFDSLMEQGINQTTLFLPPFNNLTTTWDYQNMTGPAPVVMSEYMEQVIIPIAHMNMNLMRPIFVLVIAPMFKLDPSMYLLTSFNLNVGFSVLMAVMYPETSSAFFIMNRFMLICILAGVSLVMIFRVRQIDRFLRFNFLHAKTVEERARASYLQKEIIIKENKSLKRLLEERTSSLNNEQLDFDSPMAKVIMDLKNLQRTASLSPETRENLDEIVLLLSKKGQNLFAPDIHEQLKQKRGNTIDRDTQSWAATVLTNRTYTRNRQNSTVPGSAMEAASKIQASLGFGKDLNSSGKALFVPTLHSDVMEPSQQALIQVQEMMNNEGWNLDTHIVAEISNNKPITFVTLILFERHSLYSDSHIDRLTLTNFLWFLDIGYYRNPYHNNRHAADVINSLEYILVDNCLMHDYLNTQEVFAAIIAAATHDFRHPGKTNNFMVKSGSELAVEYSDSSVLERMHLAEMFFLARDPQMNIFFNLTVTQFTEVRKAIIEMVLSTDLSVHLSIVGSLKTALISQDNSEILQSPVMLMKIVIKLADLGHSAKTTSLHARWSELIIEEFFLQGDEEQKLGLELSPFMNRNAENSAKNQVGFFDFIVLPFFDAVADVVFPMEFRAIVDQAHLNYKLWKKAESMQLNSIKDILDQVFFCERSSHSNNS